MATAGTIIDENTTQQNPATNINPATESICPKGWTLPSNTQNSSQRDIASFSPVLGGYYSNDTLYNEDTRGFWWGSTAYNGGRRYRLGYNGSTLYTNGDGRRYNGFYIRCVAKQKTITDLAYMQDVTDEVIVNTPDGATATLTDRRDETKATESICPRGWRKNIMAKTLEV